jgi:hypothetical protein
MLVSGELSMTSVCDEPLVLGEDEPEAEAELEPGLEGLEEFEAEGLDVLDEHAPSPTARRLAAAAASTRLLVNGLVDNIFAFLSGVAVRG